MTEKQKAFLQTVGDLAKKDMAKSGVLASLTTAQAILESGWGTSELAQNANALFGIKADSRWAGKFYSKVTKECYDGMTYSDVTALFRAYGSWAESVADHSAFLRGSTRYEAVIGEKDYQTACKAIKAAGYATAPDYAEKLINLIEQHDLTAYDITANEEDDCPMKIISSIMTNNPCYTGGRKLEAVKGLMLHSVGCPQPSAQVFINQWNKSSYNSACVHAFIDGNTGDVYQTLPWNWRGWHGASGSKGSVNNTHIGVEMCEPSTISYTGGSSWKENGDGTNTKATVLRTYHSAVQLFAYLCGEFNLNPLADGVIISHSEGYKRGIASNHGDVEHIWNKFGLTMDQFRKDVAAAKNGTVTSSGTNTSTLKFNKGDSVQFAGGAHYKSSTDTSGGIIQKAGPANVTATAPGAAHPYHLIHADSSSGVYGWVDAAAVTALGGSSRTYTVVHGDSLWAIAQKQLGNGNRWEEIKKLNGLTSNVIYSGQVLKLP